MSKGGSKLRELDSGPSLDGDAFALTAEDLAEGPRRKVSTTNLPKKNNTLMFAVVGVVVVGLLSVGAAIFIRSSETTEVSSIPVDDPTAAKPAKEPKTPTIPPVPIKPEEPKDPTPPPTPAVKKDPPKKKAAPVKKKKKRKKRKKRKEDKAMDSALDKLKDL